MIIAAFKVPEKEKLKCLFNEMVEKKVPNLFKGAYKMGFDGCPCRTLPSDQRTLRRCNLRSWSKRFYQHQNWERGHFEELHSVCYSVKYLIVKIYAAGHRLVEKYEKFAVAWKERIKHFKIK